MQDTTKDCLADCEDRTKNGKAKLCSGQQGCYRGDSMCISARSLILFVGSWPLFGLVVLVVLVAVFAAYKSYYSDIRDVINDFFPLVHSRSIWVGSPRDIATFCSAMRSFSADRTMTATSLVVGVYIVLQTFCLPGTVFLNVVLGSILGTWVGLVAATVAAVIGAVCCYLFSYNFGVGLVQMLDRRWMRGRGLEALQNRVRANKENLFVYLLFLRLTPILPNWFINMSSPIANIPLSVFTGATALGVLPQTFCSVRFGDLVSSPASVNGSSRIVTAFDTLLIGVVALALLFVHHMRRRFNATAADTSSRAS